jgi:glucose/arabinose dehydrogenase
MKRPRSSLGTQLARLPIVSLVAACSGASHAPSRPDGQLQTDGGTTAPTFCGRGLDVPHAAPPAGFCLKEYAVVPEARTLAFAPNGDLFVGAPSTLTLGGASGGPGAILLLTDVNHDGVGESHTFLSQIDAETTLTDVHGVAVGGGSLYFTTKVSVWSTPYTDGQLVASAPPVSLGLPDAFAVGGRWTHGLARSVAGQLIASRGAFAMCGTGQAGEISAVSPTGTLTTLASGFRNPMYLRCHAKDEVCAAMELGEDLLPGAREKMVILRPAAPSYGYPCCMTTSAPVADYMADGGGTAGLCDDVAKEDASFPLSDTPFGFDWQPGGWPAPFSGAIFVALHGSAYSSRPWKGAGIVYAPTDPTTHAPTQDWQTFLGGFSPDPDNVLHRPADVAFSPDGRMFFADDTSGTIFWVAPTTLAVPDANK